MWNRADKINLWIALIALVSGFIALIPYAQRVQAWLNRSTATISAPVNGSTFHINHNQGVTGDVHHIPSDSDLWLAIRSGVEGRWYPISQIRERDGSWRVQPSFIAPAVGSQEFVLILVPVTDDAQFIDYFNRKNRTDDPGISSLPSLATIKAISEVNVEN
jgi:hypothetical protein